MSIKLKASNNNLTQNSKYSYLNTNNASGVTTLVVTNSVGFVADDYLLLGEFGVEQAEIVQIDSIVAATHTITLKAATKFSHAESEKATIIPYNQVRFYYTTDTTFVDTDPITDFIDIQSDSLYTLASDNTNITGYGWFKFYNSTNLKLTTYSNYIPYSDFAANSAKKIIEGFLRSLNQKDSKLISMNDAFEWLSEGYSIAQTELNLVNREYKATISSSQTTTSGVSEYAFPTNASEIIGVWDSTNIKKVEEANLKDVDKYNSDLYFEDTRYYIRGNYIGFTPQPTDATVYKISYIVKTVALTSLTDTIDLPDNNFYMLKDFLRFRAADQLNKANGQMYYELFLKSIDNMKMAAIKRSSCPKSMGIDRYANI